MSYNNSLVIIKKKGNDGMTIPLDSQDNVLFGRSAEANIRIQKKAISAEHTEIFWDKEGMPMVRNLSKTNSTLLNGVNLVKPVHLHSGDMITIVDRTFRFESDRPMPAQRTPLSGANANVKAGGKKSASKKRSSLKKSATADSVAKQLAFDNDENVAAAQPVQNTPKKKASSKPKKVKQPVTRRALATPVRAGISDASEARAQRKAAQPPPMQTPLKRSIVDTANARECIVPSKSLATPMKSEIKQQGSKSRPAYADKKSMQTPLKADIKQKGSQPNAIFAADKKSMQTPIKKDIKKKGGKKNSVFVEAKSMQTPLKKDIKTKGSKKNKVFVESNTMATPIKSEIKKVGSKKNKVFVEMPRMATPLKHSIREEGAKPNQVFVPTQKLNTPLKKEIWDNETKAQIIAAHNARVAGLPSPVRLAISDAAAKQAAKQAEREEQEAEEEEAVDESLEQDDDATLDEAEMQSDDSDDSESSDDEIECNLPTKNATAAAPAAPSTPPRLGTPMRSDIARKGGVARAMYVREHTLASPMRRAIGSTASPVTRAWRQRTTGLPSPVKRAIGPAAYDFAQRAIIAAASAAAAVATTDADADADVNESADVSVKSVDVSGARANIDATIAAIEERMGGKGYTKPKMSADLVTLIAAVRQVFDELEQAADVVADDNGAKAAAIDAACDAAAADVDESSDETQEEPEQEADAMEESEEEVVVAKRATRGRPRKSMPAKTTTTAPKATKRATRKSIATSTPAEEEVADQSSEEEVEAKPVRSTRRSTRSRK